MRRKIAQKLILAFMALTVILLLVTLGLARWSFEQGFLDYTNALEQVRLERIGERLEAAYLAAGGSWETMSPELFRALRGAERSHRPPPPSRPGAARPGAAPGERAGLRPPPPWLPPPPFGQASQRRPERVGGEAPHTRAPHPMAADALGPPTALFDAQGRQIAGDTLDDPQSQPVRVSLSAGGERIGELRSLAPRHFETPQATAFARQQWQMSLVIGLVSLALAAVVSWLLARALLAPLRRMIKAVTELASGDYSVRLDERRSDELGQVMDGLDRLADALEKNRAAHQRWLADISHELRTPVTILAGEIEALKDGVRRFGPEQLESLDQEILRLRRLIEDLYTLSVADVGGLRYRFTTVDLGEHFDVALKSLCARAAEQGIEVRIERQSGLLISADPLRLDQLLTNLIENSLAYTKAPGRIEISLARRGERLSLEICDSAPGVEASDCERLFEPLYRQETSRSRRHAGAGLGLAICRNIVKAHQGEITAAPSPLGGLCVRIELPALNESTT